MEVLACFCRYMELTSSVKRLKKFIRDLQNC